MLCAVGVQQHRKHTAPRLQVYLGDREVRKLAPCAVSYSCKASFAFGWTLFSFPSTSACLAVMSELATCTQNLSLSPTPVL